MEVGIIEQTSLLQHSILALPQSRTMSTSATETTPTSTAKTVTLQNGNVFSFNSNQSTELDIIPVIDAYRIWSDKLEDRQAVADEIRTASQEIGFFYLVNHVSLG